MQQLLDVLAPSLRDRTFVSLTLSKPVVKTAEPVPVRVTVRPIDLRGERRWQWTMQYPASESHENLDEPQTLDRAALLIGAMFRHAHLFTTEADYTARVDASGGCRLRSAPPTKASAAPTEHDQTKNYLIPEGRPCPFLHELGVMTAAGLVHRAKQDKFRQINRFLELVEDVLPQLPGDGRLDVVDFGCGLSYLTFALHHLLTAVHHRDVSILGIDHNPQVIERCTRTCSALKLEGLEFLQGAIDLADDDRKVHLAVALHACDTATDDALARAVRWNSDVILAAPCCQHELAPQLTGDTLMLLTRHGIVKDRLAALATDALRAAVLEQVGYRTQIIEFIDTEHTPKNLLLRATRRADDPSPRADTGRIDELKTLLGVEHFRLGNLLHDRLP